MIQLRNITKKLGNVLTADQLDGDFLHGVITGVNGISGSGKTTLLRMIAGLEHPDQGTVTIGGLVVSSAQIMVPPHERGIGITFQNNDLWPHLRVWQQIAFALGGFTAENRKAAVQILGEIGLDDLADRFPGTLSGGQARRVSIGRAFARKPKVILMDEPFSHLDPATRDELMGWVGAKIRLTEAAAVLVSHDLYELQELCGPIYGMKEGRLKLLGNA